MKYVAFHIDHLVLKFIDRSIIIFDFIRNKRNFPFSIAGCPFRFSENALLHTILISHSVFDISQSSLIVRILLDWHLKRCQSFCVIHWPTEIIIFKFYIPFIISRRDKKHAYRIVSNRNIIYMFKLKKKKTMKSWMSSLCMFSLWIYDTFHFNSVSRGFAVQ